MMDLLEKAWPELSIVAFDTETTGKYPIESELCELAAVKFEKGKVVDEYQVLVKPSQMMSQVVIDIHNITNEMVANAPQIQSVIGDFRKFIEGSVCVAHHAPFDLGFVSIEFEKEGLSLPTTPALCTSLLGRKLIRESSNHRLQTLVKVLKIDGGQAHRALDDAKACLEVALECFRRMPEGSTLQDIINVQQVNLKWSDYSMDDLLEKSSLAHIIRAAKEKKSVDMVYEGGSRPGKSRPIEPIGIVRNPNGDFLVATENGRQPPKRYLLEKIKEAKIRNS